MLYHKKTKKVLKALWIIIGALVIVSMILLYTPIFLYPSHSPQPTPDAPQFPQDIPETDTQSTTSPETPSIVPDSPEEPTIFEL